MQPPVPVHPLLAACHPGPAAAVTALATALAVAQPDGVESRPGWVLAAFAAGQLSVGWSNDWVDADRDRAVGRQDKPVVRGLPVATVRAAALAALVACVPLSLALGVRAGTVHLVAVASAWAYNLGLKATLASWLPYAVSFGLLPSVITQVDGRWAPWWATAAGALLGVGAHAANVLPDLEQDARTGVRGLPQRLGGRGAAVLAGGCLLAATALLDSLVALAVAVVVFGAGLLRGGRAVFLGAVAVAALDVGLLLLRGARLTGRG